MSHARHHQVAAFLLSPFFFSLPVPSLALRSFFFFFLQSSNSQAHASLRRRGSAPRCRHHAQPAREGFVKAAKLTTVAVELPWNGHPWGPGKLLPPPHPHIGSPHGAQLLSRHGENNSSLSLASHRLQAPLRFNLPLASLP